MRFTFVKKDYLSPYLSAVCLELELCLVKNASLWAANFCAAIMAVFEVALDLSSVEEVSCFVDCTVVEDALVCAARCWDAI